MDPLRYALAGVLGAALLAAMVGTHSWPLVGDAALMHYVVFLLKGGAIPYAQVVDINLPGTYLFEAIGMACFGTGAWGLRLYDWALLTCLTLACVGVSRRKQWFAGVFAGLLFALIHLKDGIEQQGQRDLLLAVLLLVGLGALRLLLNETPHPIAASFVFGLSFGISFTIKPVLLPATVLLFALGLLKTRALRSFLALLTVTCGLLLPALLTALWLYREGALRSFLFLSRSLLPLHAALGRRPLAPLAFHSLSPLGPLLLCCLALLLLSRTSLLEHKLLLVAGLLGGELAFLLQGKGYPYQRYPFLVVLLLTIGLVLDRALDTPQLPGAAAALLLCWAAGLGVRFAFVASAYDPRTPTVTALSRRLAPYGSADQLSGKVQCLDTFGGCLNTLYDLGIKQSTGFLYDCYLFTNPGKERSIYRQQFWSAFQHAKPELVVISSQNCFTDQHDGYNRLATWPALANELRQHYRLVDQWEPTAPIAWFSHKQVPFGFKLLQRMQ